MPLHLHVTQFQPWSVSKASLAGQCPKAFKHRYMLKTEGIDDNTAARVGTAVHRAQELVLQGKSAREAVAQAIEENPTLKYTEIEDIKAFMPALIAFKKKLESFKVSHPLESFHTELKLAISPTFLPCDYEDRTALLRGGVDVLLETRSQFIIVIDHKTGKRKPIEKHLTQLDAYSVMALAHFPQAKGVQTAIHHVAYNTEIDWGPPRSRDYVESTLQPWLLQYLTENATGLEGFSARVTPLCGWCSYRNDCDEWAQHGQKTNRRR